MDPVQALLIGVVAPGAVAALLVLGLRRAWRAGDLDAAWAAAPALAAAYGVVFALLLGWPAFPPADVTHASPWFAALAALFAAAPRGRHRGLVATALSLALGVGVGVLLVTPLAGRVLDTTAAALVVTAIAATFVALDRGLAVALEGLDPRGGAAATATLAAGAAAAVMLSDSASLGQVTGALAAAAGFLFVLGPWRPAIADLRAATPVVAAVLATNLWSAVLYAGGRYEVLVLLALAPLALYALRRVLTRPRRALFAAVVPALLMLVPVGAAVGLAANAYFAASAPNADTTAPAAGAPGEAPATPGYDPNYGY